MPLVSALILAEGGDKAGAPHLAVEVMEAIAIAIDGVLVERTSCTGQKEHSLLGANQRVEKYLR
jgi:hypothetical protein